MPETDARQNGDWGEYRRLLVSELERLDGTITALLERIERGDSEMRRYCSNLVTELRREVECIRDRIRQIDIDSQRIGTLEAECTERRHDVTRIDKEVAELKVKGTPKWAVWVAFGGLIPALTALIWWLMARS